MLLYNSIFYYGWGGGSNVKQATILTIKNI